MTKFKRAKARILEDKRIKSKGAYRSECLLNIGQIRETLKIPELDLLSKDKARMPLKSVIIDGEVRTISDAATGGLQSYDKLRYPYFCYMAVREGGFTINQLAQLFFVDAHVIGKWFIKYPDFKKAFDQGRDEFISRELEPSLLKAAKGYTVTEKHYTVNSKGEEVIKTVEKEIPPNINATIFYLVNRNKKRWKTSHMMSKENEENTISDINPDNPVTVEKNTPESAANIIDILKEAGAVESEGTGSNNTQNK